MAFEEQLSALPKKQQKFVIEYAQCFNATEAARRAEYAHPNVQGSRLLANVSVSAALEALFDESVMSAREVLFHLTQIARGDMADITNTAGRPDILKASDFGKSNLIKKIKSKTIIQTDKDGEGAETHEEEIEIYDRLKALELLAKYHDLINKVRVTDWQDEVIELLVQGKITPDDVYRELGDELAGQLFKRVGPVTVGAGETTRQS